MLLRRALPAAHFDRNATTPVTDLVHLQSVVPPVPGRFFERVPGTSYLAAVATLWRALACQSRYVTKLGREVGFAKSGYYHAVPPGRSPIAPPLATTFWPIDRCSPVAVPRF